MLQNCCSQTSGWHHDVTFTSYWQSMCSPLLVIAVNTLVFTQVISTLIFTCFQLNSPEMFIPLRYPTTYFNWHCVNKVTQSMWYFQEETIARTSIRSPWIRVRTASSGSAFVEAQSMASASSSVRWRTPAQHVSSDLLMWPLCRTAVSSSVVVCHASVCVICSQRRQGC